GDGTHLWTGGAITFNGTVTGQQVELAGGTLNGLGTIGGTLNWTGGTLGAQATLAITTNGLLNISGSDSKFFYGNITNAGRVTWTSEDTLYFYNAVMHNLAGGIIDIQS